MVPTLSPSSPHRPCHPHIILVSSSLSPRHPHSPQKVPMWSHGCGLHGLHPMLSPLSPWSPHRPCHPHVIPIIPTSSLYHPHHPHIIPIAPRRSPCGPHGCGLRGLHPMSLLSPWSPCRPRHPHVIPVILTPSSHCLEGPYIILNPPDTHFTHPHPLEGGGPESVKMQ